MGRPRTWTNEWVETDEGYTLRLCRYGELQGESFIDADDYDTLKCYHWRIHKQGYAVAAHEGVPTEMHRIMIAKVEGMETDHINRNKLDNRRSNLRLVPHLTNLLNTDQSDRKRERLANRVLKKRSPRTGSIFFRKWRNKWEAKSPWENGKARFLGLFDTKEEAEQAIADYVLRL